MREDCDRRWHCGEGRVGWEPWHSAGDFSATFHLLDRFPPLLNPIYIAIAGNRSLWEPTLAPILYGGIHKADLHKDPCCVLLTQSLPLIVYGGIHKDYRVSGLGFLGTLLMQEPGAKEKYAPFLAWFYDRVRASAAAVQV